MFSQKDLQEMFAMYGLDATGIEDFFNQSSAIMRAIAYPVFDPVKIRCQKETRQL